MNANLRQTNVEIFFETYFFQFLKLRLLLFLALVSIFVGSASAFFLISLDYITNLQTTNHFLLFFGPLAGIVIVFLYSRVDASLKNGNSLILSAIHNKEKKVSFLLAPLIFISTLLTHLVGGSAGREGTAVQLAAGITSWIKGFFRNMISDNKLLLICAVSAGFASVFGTPLAGTFFALEFHKNGKFSLKYVFPSLIVGFGAHYVCMLYPILHTPFKHVYLNNFSLHLLLGVLLSALLFGLCSILFVKLGEWFSLLFLKIKSEYLRVVIGSGIFIATILVLDARMFTGLGVETILKSFENPMDISVFILKILFTTLTLSIGFKGGEVTPLFFIGATLGSFLAFQLDLPLDLLASLGLVAVFAGATKTPFACSIMAAELVGYQIFPLALLTCYIAFYVSGKKGIYKLPNMHRNTLNFK